jgi:hypothetical protein
MGRRYEGLAKLATVSAVIFGVSLGLCGATLLVRPDTYWLETPAFFFGISEILGIVVGGAGLLAAGISALVQWIGSIGATDEEAE